MQYLEIASFLAIFLASFRTFVGCERTMISKELDTSVDTYFGCKKLRQIGINYDFLSSMKDFLIIDAKCSSETSLEHKILKIAENSLVVNFGSKSLSW